MTMNQSQSNRPYKILFIGDSAVGKTSLMFRFSDNIFTETFTPTIGIDFKVKTITLRGKLVRLQLWDTAGQEKFFNITRSYYRNADAIILVYDRSSASSFQNVSRWMKNIDDNAPDDVIRILVGNKSDLHHSIVISSQDGQKLADRYHVDYFETSAKSDTNSNVSKMFYTLTEKILQQYQITPKSSENTVHILSSSSDSTYDKLMSCCWSSPSIDKK
ncbi:unnamed protein product [Rotaria sp. Silwood1]|nr:unnamed protein product [Rotaria sp. Silwood1]CAF3419091.1 unnamed protein product [Rotaria sp. Silwood1]CAF3444258.1 unnamed protein product [Rotaria sp. Silwood1]CAF3446112.1 unnamed protein product [Rotaria sp. Silwood1]CAF3473581.1 unnamed protein product [Rotaria sp. Silwood1]